MRSVNSCEPESASLTPDSLPILAPHCRSIRTAPETIHVISDVDELTLTGVLFHDLAEHLHGRLTLSEITELMVAAGTATRDEVPAAVEILRDHGFVVDARAHADDASLYALWWREGSVNASLARVGLVGLGHVPIDAVRDGLRAHGHVVTDDSPDVVVMLVDDHLHPDAGSVAAGAPVPVLMARIAGPRPVVGPWIGAPGPCHACLASRLRFNRQVEARLLGDNDRMGPTSRGWTGSTAAHAAAEIALEIAENTAPVSVALTRQMLWRFSGEPDPWGALKVDGAMAMTLGAGPDVREGVAAFLEKRSPDFPGKVSTDMPPQYPWWKD